MELLDWAEDAKSLPTIPLPPSLYPPCDLSVLRSSSSSPFSSLQHCSKCFTHYFHLSRHCHSHFNSNPFYTSHYNSFKQFQPYFYTKTYPHLNWESDPWLSDPSLSLKALGWIHAHWYHFLFLFKLLSHYMFCFTWLHFFRYLISFFLFVLLFLVSFMCPDDEDIVKRRGQDGTVGCDLVVTCTRSHSHRPTQSYRCPSHSPEPVTCSGHLLPFHYAGYLTMTVWYFYQLQWFSLQAFHFDLCSEQWKI